MAEKKEGIRRLVGELYAVVGDYQLSGTLFKEAINYEKGTVNFDVVRLAFKKHYYGKLVKNSEIQICALIREPDNSLTIEEFTHELVGRKVGTKKVLRNKVKAKRRKK